MNYSTSQLQLLNFIDRYRKDHTIWAPVKVGQSDFIFAKNPDRSDIVFHYPLTILPPKKVFLPPKEILLKKDRRSIEELLPRDEDKTFLFGVHLVDIHGLIDLNLAMTEPFVDEYWRRRWENTVVIGISDLKQNKYLAETFAPDVHQGFDVYLEPIDDQNYLAIPESKEGEKIVKTRFFQETEIHEGKTEGKKTIEKRDPEYLAKVVQGTMGSRVWDELAEKCIACGICSYVCPLCYCTDTADSLDLLDNSCRRCRNWSACMLPNFAKMAGDIDPRPTLKERYRNWYYHKFVRWVREYGRVGCVGCGRCVKYCPAGINYVEVLEKLEEEYKTKVKSQKSKVKIESKK